MFSAGRLFISTLVICSGAVLPANSLAALMSTGDIAFIGYNLDGFDDFAIVLLADAVATDVVRFNNNEWKGSAFDKNNEGEISWAVGTTLAAGSVVTFSRMNSNSSSVSVGTLTGGKMSLNAASDTVYAFLGTDAETPSTFFAAVSNDPMHYDGSTATLSGTGLTQGSTAVLLPGSGSNLADGGRYKGDRTGQEEFSDYLSLIGDVSANWDVSLTDGAQYVPFSATTFQASSASVPEPGSLTLAMLAVMMGAMRYRLGAGKRAVSSASQE